MPMSLTHKSSTIVLNGIVGTYANEQAVSSSARQQWLRYASASCSISNLVMGASLVPQVYLETQQFFA